jgi:hypothetical protein
MALKRRLQGEDIAQKLILDSDNHISDYDIPFSQSDSDAEEDDRTDTGCRDWINSRQSQHSAPVVHKFTGGPSGLTKNKVHYVNKDCSPLSIFMLIFLEIMQLLLEETNICYHQYLETVDEVCCPQPNVTTSSEPVLVYYCADGSQLKTQTKRLLVYARIVLYGLLRKNNELRQILPYTEISTF